MRSDREVAQQLEELAKSDENIRAMWQWGSRADSRRVPDALSDWDIGILARTVDPFRGDGWLRPFGAPLVRWPLHPSPTLSDRWITQLVLFEDGVRIDFQITGLPFLLEEVASQPVRMLLDKDGSATDALGSRSSAFEIALPTRAEFDERVNAFFWDIVYVPKALIRNELPFAKAMLDGIIRQEHIEPLVRWYVGVTEGTETDLGVHARWLERHLPGDLWTRYKDIFAGADRDDNHRAVDAMIAFVREIAGVIAEKLGYSYPRRTDMLVSAYIATIRKTIRV
jgi:aminoglycoside 6-adenylyltransferase